MPEPQPLNRVDVSRRSIHDSGVIWLLANGYTFKATGRRVFLERVVAPAARSVC